MRTVASLLATCLPTGRSIVDPLAERPVFPPEMLDRERPPPLDSTLPSSISTGPDCTSAIRSPVLPARLGACDDPTISIERGRTRSGISSSYEVSTAVRAYWMMFCSLTLPCCQAYSMKSPHHECQVACMLDCAASASLTMPSI